ncbi:MAG: NADH-quinone oxidoreductase subunit NuoG [Armatimonadota bacterium]
MPTIYIDNEPYTIEDEGKNLLEVALSLGFNLPYFCWHPAMHSVGACRQCAVKMFRDENDTIGRIVMSCMTPAKDGTRISIDDPEAVAFRAGVIEWLMVNHPHDCPVCDEGGECHLQDMTVMSGHVYRRMRFKKRSYRNQDLGPFVNHEMNRCIQCYRCVRFYNDYAGGHDFGVFAWHDNVYFGRSEDGVLESEFSGNLVEVCPTGVFTDKTQWRHYTRKWDLQTAPSVCVHCGLGCNTIPGERYGTLRRIRNRYNGQVNGYFLCDRGRFGYEFVNSDERIKSAWERGPRSARTDDLRSPRVLTKEEALEKAADMLNTGKVIGIGSPRASLESNYALRALVGPENFYLGISRHQQALLQEILRILRDGPARAASQQDAAHADAVFVLGEDVTNYAPMLALQLRQAAIEQPSKSAIQELHIAPFDEYPIHEVIQQDHEPFYLATPWQTKLESVATTTWHAAPDDLARLGFAVAREIDAGAPAVEGLPGEARELAARIAADLKAAKRPVIVAGCGLGSLALVQAAANVAWALQKAGVEAQLSFTVPECNSLGLALLGGGNIREALDSGADTVVMLENDLYRELDGTDAQAICAKRLIALDSLENAVTEKSELVLPAAAFAEADGTLINHEGRAQRFFQVFVPKGEMQESWRWLGEMIAARDATEPPWTTLDEVIDAMVAELPALAGVREAAPSADFRLVGQKVPRQSHRNSGRTAIYANTTVFEPPPPADPDSPLAFSMEGYQGKPPAPLIPRFWAPGWNSHQAVTRFQQEVGGPLRGGDPGVRLLEPPAKSSAKYYPQAPAAFKSREDAFLIIPAYHIFGSEELSRHAQGIAALAPAPYLALSPDDADRLGVKEGQPVVMTVEGQLLELPVRITPLPAGVAALPAGLPETRGPVLPAWGSVVPAAPGGEEAEP